MSTTLPLMTADQLEAMPDDGHRYDLLRGELLQMSPASREHGRISSVFGSYLTIYVLEHDLGETLLRRLGSS